MRSGCSVRSAGSFACGVSFALVTTLAHGDPRPAPPPGAATDASYGRIDGDLAAVFGAGVSIGPRAPRAALDVRFRYLDSVGIFFQYEDAPIVGASSDPRRVFATGVELRPLFIGRWLTGRESSTGRLDLLVDSVGLELGAVFSQPIGATFPARPGVQAGIGVELPLLASASGPWIGVHGGVRFSDAAMSGEPLTGPSDRALFLSITLAWHQLFLAHAVDAGDRAPR
jgi:hypothetical protein